MENNKEITIGYWSTKGLGSTLRMITIYSGRPLRAKIYKLDALIKNNEIQFDGSTWHDKDKVHLKKRNSLINLPYVEMYDKNNNKVLISQSLACLSFLGRQLNMFGKDTSEETYCDQLINEVNDLRGLLGKFCYTTFLDSKDEFNGAKDVMEKATNKINGKMLKFEEWLEQKKQEETKLFLVGNSISAPDFSLFDILDFYNEFLRHYKFSTNSLGFRDFTNRNILKKNDKKRILLIGDSFIEGAGYDYAYTIGGLLQNYLGEEFEVLNSAVGSYSPSIYFNK